MALRVSVPGALTVFVMVGMLASSTRSAERLEEPYLVVLGVAQDGGYPQPGCRGACCREAWKNPGLRRRVASVAIVDPESSSRWLVDATPDFPEQLRSLDTIAPVAESPGLAGIFLTHGHIGHYTGLMYLGREAMGAAEVPVYVMPRMKEFLSGSGPWSQLVRLRNIELRPMKENVPVRLNSRISVTPIRVAHRDEYTETVGFLIKGPRRSVLYLPDIDRWEKWAVRLETILAQVDVSYLDGTFYSAGELPGRSLSEVPHPLISETIKRLAPLPASERTKVRFIHLNHTNPALDPHSATSRAIRDGGFRLAAEGEKVEL